jgi:multiple sugar transport system permease protein
LGFNAQKWLLDPKLALPAVIIVSVWQHLGYDVVIFLAGLQNINKEYYEAAKVDGANGWQTFRHITWPLLSPTTFFISIISIIGAFKIFTTVFVLFSGPGPLNSAMTIVYYIYQNAFVKWKMGYASAAAYVLFFIIFIFTLVQLRLAKNRVHY